jgi:hypothetical protein
MVAIHKKYRQFQKEISARHGSTCPPSGGYLPFASAAKQIAIMGMVASLSEILLYGSQ